MNWFIDNLTQKNTFLKCWSSENQTFYWALIESLKLKLQKLKAKSPVCCLTCCCCCSQPAVRHEACNGLYKLSLSGLEGGESINRSFLLLAASTLLKFLPDAQALKPLRVSHIRTEAKVQVWKDLSCRLHSVSEVLRDDDLTQFELCDSESSLFLRHVPSGGSNAGATGTQNMFI